MGTVIRARLSALPIRSVLSPAAVVPGAYLLALMTAELLTLTSGLVAGAVAHALLIAALVLHAIAAPRAPYRRLLIALSLPSLIRLLGLAIPVASTPLAVWYLMAGLPALLGALLAARVVDMPFELLRWPGSLRLQLLIAASGVTNGLLAYLVLRPSALPGGPATLLFTAAVVAIVVAGTEEIAFRGILQWVATEHFGNSGAGVAVSTAAFTLMYAGSLSLPFVVLMFATGLFLGWTVRQTQSLWGAISAHAAFLVGLIVVWPIVLS